MSRQKKTLSEIVGIDIPGAIEEESLTHRSVRRKNRNNNERLEFLGDAVLELVVTRFLFYNYPNLPEGELTGIRSALVCTESLSFESIRLGINDLILMSPGEESTGGRTNPNILADAFEAIVGAIYYCHGFDACYQFIKKNLLYKVEKIIKNHLHKNAKTVVQEIIQAHFKLTPYYRLVEAMGPDHNKKFTMILCVGDIQLVEGCGDSKQKAETEAARKFLIDKDRFIEIIKSCIVKSKRSYLSELC